MPLRKNRFTPVGPKEEHLKCIWMMSGNLSFKLCDRSYDCENCSLDQAFHAFRTGHSSEFEQSVAGFPKRRKALKTITAIESGTETTLGSFRLARDIFYHPNHFWARVEGGGQIRFGLDDFGQRLFGRLYSVKLPSAGCRIEPASPCLRLAYSSGEVPLAVPFTGTVTRANDRLEQQPSLVNQEPYTDGWLALVQPDELSEGLRNLHYGLEVKSWLPQEVSRFSEIVASSVDECRPNVGTTLQDGGVEIQDLAKMLGSDQQARVIRTFFGDWIRE